MGEKITFALEKRPDSTGTLVDTVIKKVEGKPDEEWCSVQDLDRLFAACVDRWDSNWNLEKVVVAIRESEID